MDIIGSMPKQAIPFTKKNEDWGKSCIDGCLGLVSSATSSRRSSMKNKRANYRLDNGEFDRSDFTYVTNPYGLKQTDFPAELKNMDIISPIVRLLKGEESRRIFEAVVKVINSDAISDKEEDIKKRMGELLQSIFAKYIATQGQTDQNGQPIQPSEDDQKQIEKLGKYLKYNYQDIRERNATQLIEYYKRYWNLKDIFVEGWEDAMISSEEIYRIDIIGNEATVRRCNPLEVYFVLPHNSCIIDDAEVIVEETWMSYSQIIDEFRSDLTYDEIKEIENFQLTGGNFGYNVPQRLQILDIDDVDNVEYSFGYSFDSRGNVRVLKCVWKSKKKIGIITTFDEQLGQEVEKVVDEGYPKGPDEKITWEWINEYWEGYKLGPSIYKNIKPCKVQRRHIDNISMCYSPYVGTVYSANNAVAVSLIDRIKTWQYLYNIVWYRTETALAKSFGKIMEFDLASLPTAFGFDIDKWAYYMQAMNISFKNSREEGNKGVALGMMSGSATSTREINMEQGQYINMHIQLLSFIEQKVGRLAGVTEQRLGAIEERELVNNVEKSISQSSLITEDMYRVHNFTKRRVYEALIETAKTAMRSGKSKKFSYVLDDLSTVLFEVDPDNFCNADYGVFVSDSAKDNEISNLLKQLAHAGLQNDKLEFSQVIDILSTDSISSMQRKMEDYEEKKNQQAQQEQQAQQQQFQAQMQQAQQFKERELELKQYEIDQNNSVRLSIAEMNAYSQMQLKGMDMSGEEDPIAIAEQTSKHQERVSKQFTEETKLSFERQKHNDATRLEEEDLKLKKKDLELKDKKIEADKYVARINKNKFSK